MFSFSCWILCNRCSHQSRPISSQSGERVAQQKCRSVPNTLQSIQQWTTLEWSLDKYFDHSFLRNQISRIIRWILSALIMFFLALDAAGMEAVWSTSIHERVASVMSSFAPLCPGCRLDVHFTVGDISGLEDSCRELFIKSSCYSTISVTVNAPGPTVTWTFTSEPKSISFSVVHRESTVTPLEQAKVRRRLTQSVRRFWVLDKLKSRMFFFSLRNGQ